MSDSRNSPLGHRINCSEGSIAACDTLLRTWAMLLSVMSNLSTTARAGSWLAILQTKTKTCFEGEMAARPDWFPSGILPVGMTVRVNSLQVCLVLLKWPLNSSGSCPQSNCRDKINSYACKSWLQWKTSCHCPHLTHYLFQLQNLLATLKRLSGKQRPNT